MNHLCHQCGRKSAAIGSNLCSNCKYPYYDTTCEKCRKVMRIRTGKDQRPHICYSCKQK